LLWLDIVRLANFAFSNAQKLILHEIRQKQAKKRFVVRIALPWKEIGDYELAVKQKANNI
jgi:hypothetical protein